MRAPTRTAPVELLGEAVWDALVAAGHDPAPAGCGRDGFDVLRPTHGAQDYVVVIVRLEGSLFGCATAGVRRAKFYQLEQTLTAGFACCRYEVDGVVFGLVVSREADAAERGLAEVRAAAASERAGAS